MQFDRIYLGTPSKVAIVDHAKHKTIVLMKEGLPDAGVYNKQQTHSHAYHKSSQTFRENSLSNLVVGPTIGRVPEEKLCRSCMI